MNYCSIFINSLIEIKHITSIMQIFFLIALIIGYTCILLVTIYILIHLVRYHHNYGIKTIAALNFLIIFDAVIIYSTLFLLSSIFFFSEVVNLILWKLSIIFGFVNLLLTSITYTFSVKSKKISYFPLIYFISLFGFLIGSLFSSNSIQFSISSSNITYKVNLTIGIIPYNLAAIPVSTPDETLAIYRQAVWNTFI